MAFEILMILGDIEDYFLPTKISEIPSEQKIIIISQKGLIAAQISSLLNACG